MEIKYMVEPVLGLLCIWHHRVFAELLQDIRDEDRSKRILYGVNETIAKEYDRSLRNKFRMVFEYELPQYESKWQDRGYLKLNPKYNGRKLPT